MKKVIVLFVVSIISVYPMEETKKLRVYTGAYSMAGIGKECSEDTYDISKKAVDGLGDVDCSIVCDGHGGVQVATMACREFFGFFDTYMQQRNDNTQKIENALRYATNECEKKSWEQPFAIPFEEEKKLPWQENAMRSISGSTLLVSCVEQEAQKLHVVWLGDSRGVLGGKNTVMFSTKDHKPDDYEEKEYVVRNGGHITSQDVARVCGSLAVSRALGDVELKRCYGKGPVSACPDYQTLPLTLCDKYYIAASKGFWNKVKNEELPSVMHDALYLNNEDFTQKYPACMFHPLNKHLIPLLHITEHVTKKDEVLARSVAARLVYIAVVNRYSADDTTVVVTLFDWK